LEYVLKVGEIVIPNAMKNQMCGLKLKWGFNQSTSKKNIFFAEAQWLMAYLHEQ
jgi:hypothetical protein